MRKWGMALNVWGCGVWDTVLKFHFWNDFLKYLNLFQIENLIYWGSVSFKEKCANVARIGSSNRI